MADKNPFFAIKPDDPKDVSWGLTTADACWRRGDRTDALRWLRRAVEAASEAEADDRALELAKIAADLATQIGATAAPPPPPVPAAAQRSPQNVQVMPAIARTAVLPRPLIGTGKTMTPLAPRSAPPAKESPKKPDRKSITNEGPRSRSGHALAAKVQEKAVEKVVEKAEPAVIAPPLPPPRKRSTSRADKAEASQRQPSRTDEIDEWPTEVVVGKDLAASLASEKTGPVSSGGAAVSRRSTQVVAAQAVRVLVWREANGSVQVSAAGGVRIAPSHALEATLVGNDAAADLLALLTR